METTKEILYNDAVSGEISAPASKSFSQRAIVAALLSNGDSHLSGVDQAQDTLAALSVARTLGATVQVEGAECRITPCEMSAATEPLTIDIGESGLSARLFVPLASLLRVPVTIVGRGSIIGRPMDFMQDAMEQLGVKFHSANGKLPITISNQTTTQREIRVDGSHGSQFISGLLFALAATGHDAKLMVDNLHSKPYVDMTLDVLKTFGVVVQNSNYKEFTITSGQQFRGCHYTIEGDWSGAACLLVAGATSGRVTIHNLNRKSGQADRAIMGVLEAVGAHIQWEGDIVGDHIAHRGNGTLTVSRNELRPFTFDATHCPDLFPALAALGAACHGTSQIIGTNRLQHKESDRAAALKNEFGKMGVKIDLSLKNIMRIEGNPAPHHSSLEAWGDHRIAMAMAVAALRAKGKSIINGAQNVAKSYPEFWDDLSKITTR